MFFLTFKWNFLYYRWCTLSLVLSLGKTKNLPEFFTPSHQVFIHIDKLSLEFLLLNLSQSLPYERYSNLGPSLDSIQYHHVPLVVVSPELDPALQMGFTTAE